MYLTGVFLSTLWKWLLSNCSLKDGRFTFSKFEQLFTEVFFFFFILILYCYSITVVCLFSPSLHPTPAKPPSLLYLHPPSFWIHSSADGHLGCFQYLAIVNYWMWCIMTNKYDWMSITMCCYEHWDAQVLLDWCFRVLRV